MRLIKSIYHYWPVVHITSVTALSLLNRSDLVTAVKASVAVHWSMTCCKHTQFPSTCLQHVHTFLWFPATDCQHRTPAQTIYSDSFSQWVRSTENAHINTQTFLAVSTKVNGASDHYRGLASNNCLLQLINTCIHTTTSCNRILRTVQALPPSLSLALTW